jgi:hypothetical protein
MFPEADREARGGRVAPGRLSVAEGHGRQLFGVCLFGVAFDGQDHVVEGEVAHQRMVQAFGAAGVSLNVVVGPHAAEGVTFDGVGSGDEAQRRLVLAGEGQQGVGELGGVAGLLPVDALPGCDRGGGAWSRPRRRSSSPGKVRRGGGSCASIVCAA